MPTPQSGPGKWVTFRMTGGGGPMTLTLPINPEELQRSSPARVTTTQTLGGIFQDIDGIGVQTLMIQGTTGWRTRPDTGLDGFQYMEHLYKYIYEEYYRRVKAGTIPELLLIDGVNNYTYQITIDDFQVMRSKSESLLFRYTMQMTIVQNMNDPPEPEDDPITLQPTPAPKPTQNGQTAVSIGQSHNTQKRTYKVQAGDTLWGIATTYYHNGSKDTMLAQVNHIKNPNLIYPGQVFEIPYI